MSGIYLPHCGPTITGALFSSRRNPDADEPGADPD
jgi:hypothetical protein